jgi:hypothetical protein
MGGPAQSVASGRATPRWNWNFEAKEATMTAGRILNLLCALLLCAVTQCPASDDANSYKVQLSEWSYGRIRKTVTSSNRVVGNLTVKNSSDSPLKNVTLVVLYTVASGEKAAEPVKKVIGDFKAGESRKVEVVGDFVPAFEAYEMTVTYDGGGKELWFSSSDVGQPQPKNTELIKGIANLVILGRDGGIDKASKFNGSVRVKNEGTVEAKNVKFVLTFFDAKKQKIAEVSDKLGTGKIAGGAELTIPFSANNCPRTSASYVIKVVCDDTPAEAADFTGVEDVEFAKFAFKREPKSPDVTVSAQVRNGFSGPVEHATLLLSFTNAAKKEVKNFSYEVPGKLEGGETKSIEFKVPALPAYEGYDQKISYVKLDGGAAPAASPAPESASSKMEAPKFKNIEDIEVIFTSASTNDDKSVLLIGALRNGRPTAVKDVVITVTFTMPKGEPLDGQKTLSDVIQPGEQRNFVLKTASAAGYKEYSYKFTSAEAK